jgi:hypothetical protein
VHFSTFRKETRMVATSSAAPYSAPIWPVIIAPLVAGIYYLAIRSAFAQSIISVLGQTATTDIDLSDVAAPQWGSHWIYRGAAELIATGAGTFIAAGIARGREHVASIIGGCTISLGFIIKLGLLFMAWKYLDPEEFFPEPWYQYAIDGLMIFVPLFIGISVVEAAEDLNREEPHGFGGINRFHFVWLWVAAFWYTLGLITPMARIYTVGPSVIHMMLILLVNAIPAAAIAIPGYYGMALLAGHHGNTMHPLGRNLVGMLVLVFGFLVGAAIQYGWYFGMQKIGTAIFG